MYDIYCIICKLFLFAGKNSAFKTITVVTIFYKIYSMFFSCFT
jgi:hypothetical protein